MIKLKCKCSREWEYNGRNKYYATCPDCRTMVPIRHLTKEVNSNE